MTEPKSLHATVREGYQILLRADADYLLPTEQTQIRRFYERLTDTCLKWALEVLGERLRREFLALESVREKSQFRTQRYHLSISVPFIRGAYAAFLCESRLTGQWKMPQQGYHRAAQVWNIEEETMLPQKEILSHFGIKLTTSMLPFRPHGIYPDGAEMVFFRNASEHEPFAEVRLSMDGETAKETGEMKNQEKQEKNEEK